MPDNVARANSEMTVLILGAYGLIGSGIARRVLRDGHRVIGFGRDLATGKQVLPTVDWISGDLRFMTSASDWGPVLAGVDVVINCSGALQDGPDDDLEAVHHHAISALAAACVTTGAKIIQISATGAHLDAPTAFLASKARGDAAIQNSGVNHHIFRPGLVLAHHSYGGSSLLRMLAAVPIVQPISMADAQIQTVHLDDVAEVVSAAISGQIPNGYVGDLVESEPHALREIVASVRGWLGFAPARREVVMNKTLTGAVAKIADGLATLGWRSPLRTTAINVLGTGVTGTATDMSPFGIPPLKSLSQTLAHMPARIEDRLFARMSLVMPIIITALVAFWFLSGVIGFLRANEAARVLENVGWPHGLAVASVVFWAVVDIGIAAAFAYRPWAKRACWAAICVSLFYLGASTVFVPALWIDPLGPLVKVIPSIILAVVARIVLETR